MYGYTHPDLLIQLIHEHQDRLRREAGRSRLYRERATIGSSRSRRITRLRLSALQTGNFSGCSHAAQTYRQRRHGTTWASRRRRALPPARC